MAIIKEQEEGSKQCRQWPENVDTGQCIFCISECSFSIPT